MNHMLDVGDVEASRSNIGGNQKARGGGGEPVQVLQSLLLVELGMKGKWLQILKTNIFVMLAVRSE